MKTISSKLLFPIGIIVMILCTGCPYESSYPLNGTKMKYDKKLIGNWTSGEAELKITRIDDYKFKYYFDDHEEEYGSGEVTGIGYTVANKGSNYLVIEKKDQSVTKYLTYKIVNIDIEEFEIISLDEDNMTKTSFSSAKDFTTFIISSPVAFPAESSSSFEKGVFPKKQ